MTTPGSSSDSFLSRKPDGEPKLSRSWHAIPLKKEHAINQHIIHIFQSRNLSISIVLLTILPIASSVTAQDDLTPKCPVTGKPSNAKFIKSYENKAYSFCRADCAAASKTKLSDSEHGQIGNQCHRQSVFQEDPGRQACERILRGHQHEAPD